MIRFWGTPLIKTTTVSPRQVMSQLFHSPAGFTLSAAVRAWTTVMPGALVTGSAKVAPAIGSRSPSDPAFVWT